MRAVDGDPMITPELRVNTWHPWDNRPVECPAITLDASRQRVTRDGAETFIATVDLMVVSRG
ncbi:hypothetical protein CH304_00325 [Rhodococcus sp. 15-649-1-2]|nr:hypothetical protein CH304_00325 [Rhodococcus sp. 15-649-1-2]